MCNRFMKSRVKRRAVCFIVSRLALNRFQFTRENSMPFAQASSAGRFCKALQISSGQIFTRRLSCWHTSTRCRAVRFIILNSAWNAPPILIFGCFALTSELSFNASGSSDLLGIRHFFFGLSLFYSLSSLCFYRSFFHSLII